MQVTKTLSPGANGTKRFTSEYGDKLVCVRYRNDLTNKRRLTSIELIVEERMLPEISAAPTAAKYPDTLIQLPIQYHEVEQRKKAKELGAKWIPHLKKWEMCYRTALKLKIANRVSSDEIQF